MLLLRVLAILAVIAIASGVALYLFTGNRKYLGFSIRLLKIVLGIVLLTFVLIALEKFLVIDWGNSEKP